MGSVEKIFKNLLKSLEWRSFFNHDLPLLMDFCEEVQEISIQPQLSEKRRVRAARRAYLSYMEAGLDQGRRDELVGGGLIRSLGGCSEVKRLRSKGQAHMMSDERILGESEFVDSGLSQANERYERRYELQRRSYGLDRIAKRVAEVYGMEEHEVFSKGRQQRKVKARSLLCFWAVRELGMSLTDLARELEMSIPGVGIRRREGRNHCPG